MLQAKWFQEFHPIGGVLPRPLSRALVEMSKVIIAINIFIWKINILIIGHNSYLSIMVGG
jgi:hypothetical protein